MSLLSKFYERRTVDGITGTKPMRRVLLVLLTDATNLGGFTICQAAGVGSGDVYVCLARLEAHLWVTGSWEEGVTEGRRRRFYRLTPDGWAAAHKLLGLEPAEVRRG